jgi:hypothetical protein
MDFGTMAAGFSRYDTIFFRLVSFYCPRREVVAQYGRLHFCVKRYAADVRIAPHFFIYGPNMAASSGTGGSTADADGPRMLAAEAELLEALERLSSAATDAAWQEAVNARDTALRRLLLAVSDMSLDDRELVVTRATQALSRDRPAPPLGELPRDGAR